MKINNVYHRYTPVQRLFQSSKYDKSQDFSLSTFHKSATDFTGLGLADHRVFGKTNL